MARKRKKLKVLDYNSPEYWNLLLEQEGLTMSQGRDPRLIYDGDASALESLERTRSAGGRKLPHKGAE
jgi:hypothetical protein